MAKLTLKERFKKVSAGSGDALEQASLRQVFFVQAHLLEKVILIARETDHM